MNDEPSKQQTLADSINTAFGHLAGAYVVDSVLYIEVGGIVAMFDEDGTLLGSQCEPPQFKEPK